MKLFRSTAAVLALTTAVLAMPASAQQNTAGGTLYETETPAAFAMIGDLLIARPLLIAATVVGAGVFVLTLPFSAGGGNIGKAGQALVVEPGKSAFVRCLGCTESGYNVSAP
ncbi:multidrug transporter [Pseudomonas sp. 5P_3.1_Bac2]|uniref:multidrug transporter n=1 Tax=Pseudomonas sp. 5P_3.1_Bac2 TaxID=2971617 RepID=UPI0021C71158|nr:multidrug transporter [Pseudomonas sp. 5P_3.1_Bac2]MCU1718462.1 multidrug transporter [Pseudomonas sp. 5P_3.1_Bac2]